MYVFKLPFCRILQLLGGNCSFSTCLLESPTISILFYTTVYALSDLNDEGSCFLFIVFARSKQSGAKNRYNLSMAEHIN